MRQKQNLGEMIILAQDDLEIADDLIRSYLPFIKAEVSSVMKRYVDEHDDEVSIGMMAFHEAINAYSKTRGAFLKYASLTIKSRLIDYFRVQKRHDQQISLDQTVSEDESISLLDMISNDKDSVDNYERVVATEVEIKEFNTLLKDYDLSLEMIIENTPKQARTLEMTQRIIRYAFAHPEILDQLVSTKKLPLKQLCEETMLPRKSIERQRVYIVGMLLVLTNGFDLMRDHLQKVIQKKGDMVS